MCTMYQVRSISLPSKSHPSILKINERIDRLRSLHILSPCTTEVVCSSLAELAELYVCVDGFLNMESTREVISDNKEKFWVSEVLDGSVQILDICSSLRDAMVEVKEHVQDIQLSLRRRHRDFSVEKSICRYACVRKKMKKDSKNMIKLLNRMAHKIEALVVQQYCTESFRVVVQILIQVNLATVLVYKSLMSFLSAPVLSTKKTKWHMIKKMRRKKKVAAVAAWEDACVNEFTCVDAVLLSSTFSYLNEGSCNKAAPIDKLMALESSAESIEIHLERIFRNVVTARVSLLNTYSQ